MRRPSRTRSLYLVATVLALAAVALMPRFAATAAAGGPTVEAGEVMFDGPGAAPSTSGPSRGAEFLIENFSSDGQIVRWPANSLVSFCSIDTNRPASITSAQFLEAIRLAVLMWDNIDAAVGVRYAGACTTTQANIGDLANEIAWDDARNFVSGTQAGVTRGTWLTSAGASIGYFDETDIMLSNNLDTPEICLRTLLAHEMGHALGFGHSDTRSDLMWPSYISSDLTTCRPTASTAEVEWLINLYGTNRKPVLTKPEDRTAMPGATVSLAADASDPDGDALTYEWRQTAGPTAAITVNGATILLTAPASGVVTIEVSALDRFHHRATSTVTVTVVPAVSPPPAATGFRGTLAPVGVTLTQWGGGNVSVAVATPGVRSIWISRGGAIVGYLAGAPDFVNQPFLALFPGGTIPADTFLLVVTG